MSDIEEISGERQDLPPSCSLTHRQLSQRTHPSTTSSSSEVGREEESIVTGLPPQEEEPDRPHQTVVTLHRQPSCVVPPKELTFKVTQCHCSPTLD